MTGRRAGVWKGSRVQSSLVSPTCTLLCKRTCISPKHIDIPTHRYLNKLIRSIYKKTRQMEDRREKGRFNLRTIRPCYTVIVQCLAQEEERETRSRHHLPLIQAQQRFFFAATWYTRHATEAHPKRQFGSLLSTRRCAKVGWKKFEG